MQGDVVGQLHQGALPHQDVLRERADAGQSLDRRARRGFEGRPLPASYVVKPKALRRLARIAVHARSARRRQRARDSVTGAESDDGRTDRLDDAGHLVADHDRQLGGHGPGHVVQIAVAQTHVGDGEPHLVRFGIVDPNRGQLQRLVDGVQHGRTSLDHGNLLNLVQVVGLRAGAFAGEEVLDSGGQNAAVPRGPSGDVLTVESRLDLVGKRPQQRQVQCGGVALRGPRM